MPGRLLWFVDRTYLRYGGPSLPFTDVVAGSGRHDLMFGSLGSSTRNQGERTLVSIGHPRKVPGLQT